MRRWLLAAMLAALVAPVAADEPGVRSESEIARMMREGVVTVTNRQRHLQVDLRRATRMVLRQRPDCLAFTASEVAPKPKKGDRETVFRVTCEVAEGGSADFFVRRSRIGKGRAHIRREPPPAR